MNRRTFLGESLAASALASAAAAPAPAARQPLRIGFLGTTHSHASGKLAVVRESPDWKLVGVCEEDAGARERLDKQRVQLMDMAPLIKGSQVVAVESDVRDHFRHAKAALMAGKDVHLEKAPTASLPEFKLLLELAQKHQCRMQMGYMWRYHPGFSKLIEAVREGWLGEITSVRCAIDSHITAPAARAALAEFRGGGMFELGCHLIDVIVRMLGRPRAITPALHHHGRFDDGLADNTHCLFEYPKTLVTLGVNLLHPNAQAHRFIEVVGTRGTARMQPLEPPELRLDLAQSAGPYPAKPHVVPLLKYQRYAPELADLADAIRTKRPLAVTPETDLLVHECVLAACKM